MIRFRTVLGFLLVAPLASCQRPTSMPPAPATLPVSTQPATKPAELVGRAKYLEMRRQLNALMTDPGLVVRRADGARERIALQLTSVGDFWDGTAYTDQGGMVGQWKAHVAVREFEMTAAGIDESPKLDCRLYEKIGPPATVQRIVLPPPFVITFDEGKLAVTGKDGWQIGADAEASRSLAAGYEESVQVAAQKVQALQTALGAMLFAERDPEKGEDRVQFVLKREGVNTYRLSTGSGAKFVPESFFTDQFSLVVRDGQAVLVGGQPRQLTLRLAADGKTVTLKDDGPEKSFAVIEALSDEALAKRMAASDAFVASVADRPLTLVGALYRPYGKGFYYVRPIRLELKGKGGIVTDTRHYGAVSPYLPVEGTLHTDAFDLHVPVEGRLRSTLGGALLRFGVPPGTAGVHNIDEAEGLFVQLKVRDGPPTGRARLSNSQTAFVDLFVPTPEHTRQARAELDRRLEKGCTFRATLGESEGVDLSALTLTAGADGKVAGTITFEKTIEAAVTGTIAEAEGCPVLDLEFTVPPKLAVVGSIRLWAVVFDGNVHLSGQSMPTRQTDRPRFVSLTANEQP